MSHTSTLDVQFKDVQSFEEACKTLGFDVRVGRHKIKLFGWQEIEVDASAQMPGWRYPIGLVDNRIHYDHWGSESNTRQHLISLTKEYVKKAVTKLARKKRKFIQTTQQGGKLRLAITI